MNIEKEEKVNNHIDNKATIYYYIVNENRVEKITYNRELLQFGKNSTLKEEQEEYKVLDKINITNKHDKTYRNILGNKKDVVYIINQVLNLEKEIKQEELEKYNSSFVTNELKNKEADVVYKMKEKEIFFLIEHQNKIDYSMPYRLEEYRLEIIKSAIDIKRITTKKYTIPEVIPIVIYTGKRNWNANLYLHSIQDERFKDINLQRYNLIDINKFNKQILLDSDYLIDKMFLLEKAKSEEEIEEAITSTKNKEDRQKLIKIIQKTLKEKISEEKLKELIKKENKEEKSMEEILDRVIRYERKEERKNTIKNIINKMLQKGIEVDDIKELTGVAKKEIEEIKKTMKN